MLKERKLFVQKNRIIKEIEGGCNSFELPKDMYYVKQIAL